MIDTYKLVDVTNKYINKTIAIKSLEVNQYLSSNTDQNIATIDALANRSTASTWEYYKVEAGDYGEVGLRSVANGNFLSARIDIDSQFAPIRAAYGQNYEKPLSWESFRIYEKNGIQYIHSQANRKWIQVVADNTDHPVKAASKVVSTWERFQIEIVDYSPNNNTVSEIPSADIPTNISNDSPDPTIVSQYYWKSNYINGWYEGEFLDGLRYGYGTVVYENGYKDEGTFYGWWQDGKIIFEGKRWLINDTYNGYWPVTITATGTSTSAPPEYGDWHSVK